MTARLSQVTLCMIWLALTAITVGTSFTQPALAAGGQWEDAPFRSYDDSIRVYHEHGDSSASLATSDGLALLIGRSMALTKFGVERETRLRQFTDLVAPSPTVRFDRSAHYGGSQTNGPTAQALREAGEGAPCPSCGRTQVSGTNTQAVPEHSPSLLEHYYDHGGHLMTDAQRRAYAQSAEAFDGTLCLTCQRSHGGSLSHLSRCSTVWSDDV